MNIRGRLTEILGKFWWLLLIIVVIGYFFTDIPIFKYIIYIIAIPIALLLFLPFIIQLFSPIFALAWSLIEHFKEAQNMPFGKKYLFVPAALVAAISFATAQMILSIWVFILCFIMWASVIGFFWTFILTFFGLAPLIIITAPFLAWYKVGFSEFIGMLIFFLMTLFWFGFSKLSFSEDYSRTPEDFLGYSPQIFLLGALSFQIIALPFYHFSLFEVGDVFSDLGGGIFLLLSLIATFKWRAIKKKLPVKEREYLYRPSVWIYILGFVFTNILYLVFQRLEVSIAVITWLNVFFFAALIGRFIKLFHRKKTTSVKSDYSEYNKNNYDEKEFSNLEQDLAVDPPEAEEQIDDYSIDEIAEEITAKREIIADLSEEVSSLKNELAVFEAEYHGRIGVLYVKLDELELAIKEYLKRIELLESGKVKNLVDLEKEIEEQFKTDYQKIKEEKEEAEQYSEEYERVKEKPKLDEESEKRLKSLYRELAKKYHPDMARTPEDKEKFHKIMAEINQAYNDRDLKKMEELAIRLKYPEKIFVKESLEEEFERLMGESKKLDEIISDIENELDAIKNSDTYKFKMKVDEAKAEEKDLLKEMEDGLKTKINQKDEELKKMKQEFKDIVREYA